MAKKLLVKTPVSKDGKTVFRDENDKIVYRENIVELSAKRNFESLNSKLKPAFKHILEEVEVSDTGKVVDQEKLAMAQEIEELKKQLAEKNEGGGSNDATLLKTGEVIAKIKEAKSEDEVNALIAGDDRKTVNDAAAKKIEELKANQ